MTRHDKWANAAEKAKKAAEKELSEQDSYAAARETMEKELEVATPAELRTMVFILTFGGIRPPEDFERE